MTDYALNDRGSLEIVTENFYDTEIMRVFGGLSFGKLRTWEGPAALVPEPDNPFDPTTVSVRIGRNKIGHLAQQDAQRYWPYLARVVASGYTPVAPLKLEATVLRQDGQAEVDATARLSIAAPDLLFPLNTPPAQAAVLPQGPSIKVLDEQEFAEYLHGIVPPSGEGRVMLTLEVNKVRNAHGQTVDTVDVLYERRQVGRLATQMSRQFIPIIDHAFQHELLTAVWGTVRGSAYEVSMTVQAARPDEIPASWFEELPNDVPELLPPAESYPVPDAYVPAEADRSRNARKWRKGFAVAAPAEAPAGPEAGPSAQRSAGGSGPTSFGQVSVAVWALLAMTLVLGVVGVVFLGIEPLVSALCFIVAVATGFMSFYLARMSVAGR
ncbi:hypothetical protein AS188_09885 [Kocuria flava]|uniref:HIRAN domain-containing protein n=1 Tax=Kocuria flava TaxID=446860 RepID=A0A0U2XP32_9MICC|nr:hypothetical protein [Kocuria flava]ALU40002.1 hypothetical protein AS188_09885 [Kocuria flava]GEO91328.1 hypothetical protein KFL01_06340 [Kocuria flava]